MIEVICVLAVAIFKIDLWILKYTGPILLIGFSIWFAIGVPSAIFETEEYEYRENYREENAVWHDVEVVFGDGSKYNFSVCDNTGWNICDRVRQEHNRHPEREIVCFSANPNGGRIYANKVGYGIMDITQDTTLYAVYAQ